MKLEGGVYSWLAGEPEWTQYHDGPDKRGRCHQVVVGIYTYFKGFASEPNKLYPVSFAFSCDWLVISILLTSTQSSYKQTTSLLFVMDQA